MFLSRALIRKPLERNASRSVCLGARPCKKAKMRLRHLHISAFSEPFCTASHTRELWRWIGVTRSAGVGASVERWSQNRAEQTWPTTDVAAALTRRPCPETAVAAGECFRLRGGGRWRRPLRSTAPGQRLLDYRGGGSSRIPWLEPAAVGAARVGCGPVGDGRRSIVSRLAKFDERHRHAMYQDTPEETEQLTLLSFGLWIGIPDNRKLSDLLPMCVKRNKETLADGVRARWLAKEAAWLLQRKAARASAICGPSQAKAFRTVQTKTVWLWQPF